MNDLATARFGTFFSMVFGAFIYHGKDGREKGVDQPEEILTHEQTEE